MSDYIDIVSLSEEAKNTPEKLEEPETKTPPKKTRTAPIERGDKEFLRFSEEEALTPRDYIMRLSFLERLQLLFGQEAPSLKEEKKTPKAFRWGVVLLLLLLAFLLLKGSLSESAPQAIPPVEPPGAASSAIDAAVGNATQEEWRKVGENVEAEIALYEREELRRIRDYLDNRGNRGATLTSLRTQRAKKENTYYTLAQNKDAFAGREGDYQELEALVITSLAFSEKAIAAFDERNSTTLLRAMIKP